jgi:hypothetical protein
MPIIVVTADYCYDGRKHAKLPLHSGADVGQHSDDNDDDEPARLKPKERLRGIDIRRDSYNLADDMKDVYALKVIHVSEPSTTVSEHAKTTVIGENIYFDRDEKAMRELDDALRGKSKREAEEVEISEPSLIQRVRQYRSTNEKVIRSKQLMEQIKQSNKRIQNVKAGTKMRTEEYSLDECVKWALSYVFQHVDTLSAEVFEVMDEVERYEEMKRKLAGGKGVAIPKSNTKASKAERSARLTTAITAASIAQQLDKCAVDGLEAFVQSQMPTTRKLSRSRQTEYDGVAPNKRLSNTMEVIEEDVEHTVSQSVPKPLPPAGPKPSSVNGNRRGTT